MTLAEVDRFGRHHDPDAVRREDHVAAAKARAMAAIRVADAPSSRRMVTGPRTISGATEHFRRLFRNRRIDDHRRELYRILRCWQDQLALPRHRSPGGKAVGSQSIALRNFIDRRARP